MRSLSVGARNSDTHTGDGGGSGGDTVVLVVSADLDSLSPPLSSPPHLANSSIPLCVNEVGRPVEQLTVSLLAPTIQ